VTEVGFTLCLYSFQHLSSVQSGDLKLERICHQSIFNTIPLTIPALLPANMTTLDQYVGPRFRRDSDSSSASSHTLGGTPPPSRGATPEPVQADTPPSSTERPQAVPLRVDTPKRPLEPSSPPPLQIASAASLNQVKRLRIEQPKQSVFPGGTWRTPVDSSPSEPTGRAQPKPEQPVVMVDAIYIDSDDEMDEDEAIEHDLDPSWYQRQREAFNQAREAVRKHGRGPKIPIAVRNPPFIHPFAEIPMYEWKGTPLRASKTVELNDGTFLHLKTIIHNPYALSPDETHDVQLRGWLLKRCSELDGVLPKRVNELCYIYEVDSDDPREVKEQSVTHVTLADVVRVRQLVRTNQAILEQRYSRDHLPEGLNGKELTAHLRGDSEQRLYVRWKFTTIFSNTQARYEFHKRQHYKLPLVRKIESLTEEECSKGRFVPADTLRKAWRGETISGGSGEKREVQLPENDPVQCPSCGKEFPGPVSLVTHHEAAHQKGKERAVVPQNDNHTVIDLDGVEDVRRRLQSVVSLDEEPQVSTQQEHRIPRERRCYTLGDGCKYFLSLDSQKLTPHSLLLRWRLLCRKISRLPSRARIRQ